MEVVYEYHQSYPFNRVVEVQCTYVEVTEHFSNQQVLTVSKEKIAMFRKINSIHIMKIRNILREDLVLHYQYQYYPRSLENYIQQLDSEEDFRNIIDQLKTAISTLINNKIKVQLNTNHIACDEGIIKLFILPSFVIDEKELKEFYEAERKKIQIQLEEIFQSSHTKANKPTQLKQPNFIIQGNTLIFTNQQDPKRQTKPKISLTHSDTRDASYEMINNDNKYRSFQYQHKRGQFYSEQLENKGEGLLKHVEEDFSQNLKIQKQHTENNPKKRIEKTKFTACQQTQSKPKDIHQNKQSKTKEMISIQSIRDKVRQAKEKAEAALKSKRERQ